jgi:hypothetical protein
LEEADLALATGADEALEAYVRKGGCALLLPDRAQHLHPLFPHWQNMRVTDRTGTPWQGDWASSFAWLRRDGAFSGLPGGPLLDRSFERVFPAQVLANCNALDFHSRVHAGMVVGWVHKAAGVAVERRYGNGYVLVSTFRLFRDPPGEDPVAATLLMSMVQLLRRRAERRHLAPFEVETAKPG